MKNILIVEDNEELLQFLMLRLVAQGFQMLRAGTGRQALILAAAERPDLILMDIMLPDMDGAAAVRQMQEDFSTKHIPVIFISALVGREAQSEVTVQDRPYQAFGKPINPDILLKAIRAAIAH